MVELKLPKLLARVRFSLPAPIKIKNNIEVFTKRLVKKWLNIGLLSDIPL